MRLTPDRSCLMKAGLQPIFISLLLFACAASAAEWVEVPELGLLFEDAGVEGTFVVFDPNSRRHLGHDENRAGSRYVPASTFKIPHTLIGLTVGAVRTVDEVIEYGGRAQPFAAWERDMSLREAIAMSNAAIYQALARRIGLTDMREQLGRLDYGNGETGAVVDRFWLDGPLAISAMEQVAFLGRLANLELPLPRAVQEEVADIVVQERTANRGLWAKSGWENAPGAGVGWWVGWVRKGETNYPFALNMDIKLPADALKRRELAMACLRALDLVPEPGGTGR